ncbi:PE-PPE domain-containing protein [Mycolicibacterium poriferae]|uniref:PE-PPE domain-containing protein n=1 Tax=Mycolicibacterium poriferae TaxID=39694 RepID=UPI0024BBBBFA|nr:PE-PPE domain-containing protein [Mycolicibacterium poriferae]
MHSALRPYMTTGLAIVGSSVLAFAPIAPPAPAESATTTTRQVTQDVTLSARVVTINPAPDALKMGEQLQGTVCGGNGTPCYELEYAPIFTDGTGYLGFGVQALRRNLAGNLGEETTIFAFSEGATVASQWLEKHLEDPEAYPAPQNLTFVVIGNPTRKYGGSLFLSPWTESPYKVIDVAMQYDPTVDQPTNKLNSLAVLNAALGFFTNHLGKGYTDVDIDAEENSKWTEDGIEYVFVPSNTLPIVEPLRWLGLDELADGLTPGLQYLIEQAYDRDDRITNTTMEAPNESLSYVPINLLETVANIPFYAVAGTNRFAEAMRDSGSWWVYTETNVLGWDPANPEMTRAFVDFLVAIPSISGPMGEIADYWARANLPMNEGCTGTGRTACLNPAGITDQMFKVMLWDLFAKDGYTFEGPITPEYNPVSDEETYWGQEMGQDGDPVEWYGETVYLEWFAESKSFWNHLISPPEGIKTPTIGDQLGAAVNLFEALMVTWYPFVPKSQLWNPNETAFAYLFRPFAKVLCPDCNEVDPFMPTDWEVGDDIPKGLYIPAKVEDLYDEDGKYIGPPVDSTDEDADADADATSRSFLAALFGQEEQTTEETVDETTEEATGTTEEAAEETPAVTEDAAEEQTDVVSDAIQGLKDKFESVTDEGEVTDEAPAEEAPVEEDAADAGDEVEDVADETEEADDADDAEDIADEADEADEADDDQADSDDSDAGSDDSSDSGSNSSGSDSGDSGSSDSGSDSGDSGSSDSGSDSGSSSGSDD